MTLFNVQNRWMMICLVLMSLAVINSSVLATEVPPSGIQTDASSKPSDHDQSISKMQANLDAALLLIKPNASFRELNQAIELLRMNLTIDPKALNSKMLQGYATLFLAQRYLEQKNFIKAAEFAKQGFYLIDESAETHSEEVLRRYLRLRMDAFVDNKGLRCPIAAEDAQFLAQSTQFPKELNSLLTLLTASYLTHCDKEVDALTLWTELKGNNTFSDEVLIQAQKRIAPQWQNEELSLIFNHP